jgi:ubiquinone biosynthesis protein COQ9
MRSPFADRERDRLIAAILPDVAFDGWSRHALRGAARRTGIPVGEAMALFPRGAPDLAAAFSRWADRRMLDRLPPPYPPPQAGEGRVGAEPISLSRHIALAVRLRFEELTPWREAVRRGLAVLAMPQNAGLGLRLLYETVDGIWYGVGDTATDFSFYTKRATLAAIYGAALLYWLDDRSPEAVDTYAFIDRRLADLHCVAGLRTRLEDAAGHLPNPLRLLRPAR